MSLKKIMKQIRDISYSIVPEMKNLYLNCELTAIDEPAYRPDWGKVEPNLFRYNGENIIGFNFENYINTVLKGVMPKDIILPDYNPFTGQTIKTIGFAQDSPEDLGGFVNATNPVPGKANQVGFRGGYDDPAHSLTSVVLPKYLEKIADHCFYIGRIKSIILPETITYVGWRSFALNQIESLEIPGDIKRVEELAFSDNNIRKLVLNPGLEEISMGAFRDNQLREVILPEGLIHLGQFSFKTAFDISEGYTAKVVIPRSITDFPYIDDDGYQYPDYYYFGNERCEYKNVNGNMVNPEEKEDFPISPGTWVQYKRCKGWTKIK